MSSAATALRNRLPLGPQLLAALQQRAAALHGSAEASSLYFEEVHAATPTAGAAAAAPTRTICVLHGLLGTGRNLRTVITDLCRQAAERSGVSWRALLLDLRNHGKSARLGSLPPPHTLASAARDVIHLWHQQLGGAVPEVVMGHSMGGKTALELVRQLAMPNAPTGLPRQVWVLDARPNAVHKPDKPTQEVLDVLTAVKSVPLPLASRQALYDQLAQRGFSKALQQWLGSNLTQEGQGRFVWTFNVDGASAMFDDYMRQDYTQLLRSPPCGVTLHILRAMRSDRWDPATLAQVQAAVAATAQPAVVRGRTLYHELPDAGHWVHTDNPKGLVQLMLPSLLETAAT